MTNFDIDERSPGSVLLLNLLANACTVRRLRPTTAHLVLDWLRAERRRLDLELRLIGVFGLTPAPADVPRRERRREQELDWRRKALRRLRWQLPLTWCLHGLLRLLTLGLWGRQGSVPRPDSQMAERISSLWLWNCRSR